MSLLNRGGHAGARRARRVSILVLVDVALEHWCEVSPAERSQGVSILVLVDVALEHPVKRCDLIIYGVSILVLVDVALEPTCQTTRRAAPWCFNPCSRGCRSDRKSVV